MTTLSLTGQILQGQEKGKEISGSSPQRKRSRELQSHTWDSEQGHITKVERTRKSFYQKPKILAQTIKQCINTVRCSAFPHWQNTQIKRRDVFFGSQFQRFLICYLVLLLWCLSWGRMWWHRVGDREKLFRALHPGDDVSEMCPFKGIVIK